VTFDRRTVIGAEIGQEVGYGRVVWEEGEDGWSE
jgi:hypothetical protein